jgi:RNA polymerase sigma factor (sigma-70 family)
VRDTGSQAVGQFRDIIIREVAAEASESDHAETRATLETALASLPPVDGELIRLVNWEGFTLSQVARFEGIATSTIRSRYAKVLKQLATKLGREFER